MAVFEQGDIKIKGVKIHYYRTGGKKPPFVLLHGATDNGLCWMPVAEILSEQFDVVMPDAQGHGRSDRLDPAFSFENHTHQTAALIKELGLKKPYIMGHSMGAGTAANIAIAYPSLPKAIILEDPPWGPPPPIPKNDEERKQAEAFRNRLINLNKLSLEDIITEGKKMDPGWSDKERQYWARAKQQFDDKLFTTMVINPHPYEELVPQIKCPTLLIIAEKGIVTKDAAEKVAKIWKSKKPFKWVQIKGATHNIRRDNFKAYMEAVLGFVKGLD